MRISVWMAVLAAAVVSPAAAPAQGRPASTPVAEVKSAYEQLDESKLASVLQGMGMSELLTSLADTAVNSAQDVEKALVLVRLKLDQAAKADSQSRRDQLLDEVMTVLDRVVQATKDGKGYREKYRHFRATLDRAMAEGIHKVEPYADRLMYMQGTPGDAAIVDKCARQALVVLDRLQTRMEDYHNRAMEDDEYKITGEDQNMMNLMAEAKYRAGWIRMYQGIALDPKVKDKQADRETALKGAIEDLREFARAEDNSSTVKYMALLVTGICWRELGDLPKARETLQLANNPDIVPGDRLRSQVWQLRCLFELAHALTELGPDKDADSAMQKFAADGLAVLPNQKAIDMQSALLTSHLFDKRSEDARARNNSALVKQHSDRALQTLLDFTKKYPDERDRFIAVIAPRYEGKPPKEIPALMLAPLGSKKFREDSDAGYKAALEYFQELYKSAEATPEMKAEALWMQAWSYNHLRQNVEASRLFCKLAEEAPKPKPGAKDTYYPAPLAALLSLEEPMREAKQTIDKMPQAYQMEYAHALELLIKRPGSAKDPLLSSYHYKLGLVRQALGQADQSMEALKQITDAGSDYYIPARYRILKNRVKLLQGSASAEDKRKLAADLIRELKEYIPIATGYSKDENLAREAKGWAADMDLQVAELMYDPLSDLDSAVKHAQGVLGRWEKDAVVRNQCLDLMVRVYLKQGNLKGAIDLIQGLQNANELVALVVQNMIQRMGELRYMPGDAPAAELRELQKNFHGFAQSLYDDAVNRKLTPEQMYGPKQAVARSLESGSPEEADKALGMYEELNKTKPDDAANLLGKAHCYQTLKDHGKAMEQFDKLVTGLPEQSADWWRAHLERLEFALAIHGQDVKELKAIRTQIDVLRFKDAKKDLGGYKDQFNSVYNKAGDALKAAGEK